MDGEIRKAASLAGREGLPTFGRDRSRFVSLKENSKFVQIKKILVSLAIGFSAAINVAAQDVAPEKMPQRLTSEKIIREIAPLSIGSTVASVKEIEASYQSTFGESVVKTALEYIGARYSYGSTGPRVFDCSGFTSYVYRKENKDVLYRTSRSQYTQGRPVANIADLKKGDLVFFGGRGNSRRVGHVGIVASVDPDGKKFSFVHASTNKGVTVSHSTEAYYSRRYIGARRIVEN